MEGRKEYPRMNGDQSNGKSSNGMVTVEMNTQSRLHTDLEYEIGIEGGGRNSCEDSGR